MAFLASGSGRGYSFLEASEHGGIEFPWENSLMLNNAKVSRKGSIRFLSIRNAKRVDECQQKILGELSTAPHHHLEGPVEAPTSSNSVVANPTIDSSSVSTGLDTPPDPEIHRGPLTLSQLCKHSTRENFSVLVFKTQRLFVTVPGTRLVLPLSPNPLNDLDFLTRSANIPLAPEFMFAK
ncbi:hypothetical protein LXL04_027531 [Taraxacum kok-saghyz]